MKEHSDLVCQRHETEAIFWKSFCKILQNRVDFYRIHLQWIASHPCATEDPIDSAYQMRDRARDAIAKAQDSNAMCAFEGPTRWECGFRNIVTVLKGSREQFDIDEIVEQVRSMKLDQAIVRMLVVASDPIVKEAIARVADIQKDKSLNPEYHFELSLLVSEVRALMAAVDIAKNALKRVKS